MSRGFFKREILPAINIVIFIVACIIAAIICLPYDLYRKLKHWIRKKRR